MKTRNRLPTPPVPTSRHARTLLPAEVSARLGHLAVELNSTKGELLAEGAILVCRYYSMGDGLPDPPPLLEEPDAPVVEPKAVAR
jgi:hypothetical protein